MTVALLVLAVVTCTIVFVALMRASRQLDQLEQYLDQPRAIPDQLQDLADLRVLRCGRCGAEITDVAAHDRSHEDS